MAKKRITRKKLLKEPDEFITFSGKLIQWGRRYAKPLSYGAGALFIVIVLISGYRFFDNRAEAKAFARLAQANARFTDLMKKDGTPEKAYQAVKNDYQKIIDSYSGKDAAKIARVIFADICFNAKAYDPAITLYKRTLEDFKNDSYYGNIIRANLAYTYEAKGDPQKAIEYFSLLAETSKDTLKDQALFNLARLNEKSGQPQKAQALYQKIISDHPNSMFINIVTEKTTG